MDLCDIGRVLGYGYDKDGNHLQLHHSCGVDRRHYGGSDLFQPDCRSVVLPPAGLYGIHSSERREHRL